MKRTLVLLRHGQSTWNLENRFTGWVDVDLTNQGREEANAAGMLLSEQGFSFDCAYTSVLKRAIRTLWLVLDKMDLMWIPVHRAWQLNERHYGALQGLNKAETAARYGEDQVHLWRRSYSVQPPPLEASAAQALMNDERYRLVPKEQLPLGESLADTVERVLPYWESNIAPRVRAGEKVIIAAHGNSIRALVKYFDQMTESEVETLNIPTGVPLVYQLDDNLKATEKRYLGDAGAIERSMNAVAAQGRAQKA